MVLPPLELFSLRKELPCCRAALSVYRALLAVPWSKLVTACISFMTIHFLEPEAVWEARFADPAERDRVLRMHGGRMLNVIGQRSWWISALAMLWMAMASSLGAQEQTYSLADAAGLAGHNVKFEPVNYLGRPAIRMTTVTQADDGSLHCCPRPIFRMGRLRWIWR